MHIYLDVFMSVCVCICIHVCVCICIHTQNAHTVCLHTTSNIRSLFSWKYMKLQPLNYSFEYFFLSFFQMNSSILSFFVLLLECYQSAIINITVSEHYNLDFTWRKREQNIISFFLSVDWTISTGIGLMTFATLETTGIYFGLCECFHLY